MQLDDNKTIYGKMDKKITELKRELEDYVDPKFRKL